MIILPVVGGLGNQLFILTFGLYLIHLRSQKVTFYLDKKSKGNQTHDQNVFTDLDWSAASLAEPTWSHTPLAFRAAEVTHKLLREYLGVELSKRFLSEASVVENDRIFEHQEVGKFVCRGYFQSPRYYQSIRRKNLLTEISPRRKTEWYAEEITRFKSKPLAALHLRLGDYTSKSVNRALPVEYYIEALKNLESETVLVFSDSIGEAREFFRQTRHASRLYFVDAPTQSRAVESLSLLSQASELICSDSTFSWWAARTGRTGKRVIVPKGKWLANSLECDKDHMKIIDI